MAANLIFNLGADRRPWKRNLCFSRTQAAARLRDKGGRREKGGRGHEKAVRPPPRLDRGRTVTPEGDTEPKNARPGSASVGGASVSHGTSRLEVRRPSVTHAGSA